MSRASDERIEQELCTDQDSEDQLQDDGKSPVHDITFPIQTKMMRMNTQIMVHGQWEAGDDKSPAFTCLLMGWITMQHLMAMKILVP
jgi:hypothetical protein